MKRQPNAPCLCGAYDHPNGPCFNEPTHTPTPWKVYHENGSMGNNGHWGIDTVNEKKTIAVMSHYDDSRHNAAFICRAVNAHAKLLLALQYAQNHLEKLEGDGVEVNQNVMKMISDARSLAEV